MPERKNRAIYLFQAGKAKFRRVLVDTCAAKKYNINNMETDKNENVAIPDKQTFVRAIVKKYAIITLGCLLYSLGISLFVEPANLTAGGMTGISLIINKLTGFNTGYLIIILNVPMVIIGFIYLGWKFMASTAYATVLSGLLMRLWDFIFGENVLNWLHLTDSPIVNAATGAVLFGIGMGLIFRMGSSTAGTDIIVKILRKKFRHIKTSMFSLLTDLVIVGSSFFTNAIAEGTFNLDKLFYSILLVVVFTFIFNHVLYGGDSAQLVFIITGKEKAEQICKRILTDLDSGVTYLDGEGGYTGDEKKILFCVVKPYLYPHLRDVVAKVDKTAFMVVTSANEIYGYHYKNQDDEEL